jgi:hypothetical protein
MFLGSYSFLEGRSVGRIETHILTRVNSLYTIWLAVGAGYFFLAAITGQLRSRRGQGYAISNRARLFCLLIASLFAVAAVFVWVHFIT